MCGIVGIIYHDINTQVESSILNEMMESIIHRGPDNGDKFIEGNIGLGFRRLIILDKTSEANQPMLDHEKRYCLIFNGEIYNYLEIRQVLEKKGIQFRTNSDTEVVLYSYITWGEKCVDQLRGMFAFCIYDRRCKTSFIVRDRLGIKPLYYYADDQLFIFSSELKAIIASRLVKPIIDMNAVDNYLSWQSITGPSTIYQNIKVLQPGSSASIEIGNVSFRTYWSPSDHITPSRRFTNYAEAKSEFRTLFDETVQMHMMSDVPLGVFLSGGIDSTIITSIMSRYSERQVKTFSIGFDVAGYNEIGISKKTADQLNTDHNEVIIDGNIFKNEIESIINYFDQPTADGVNTYFVSKYSKMSGLTVCLSGLGGDEIFAGYHGFRACIERYSVMQKPLLAGIIRKGITATLGHLPYQSIEGNIFGKILRGADSLSSIWDMFRLQAEFYKSRDKSSLYTTDFKERLGPVGIPDIDYGALINDDSLVSVLSMLYIKYFMQNTLLRDSDIMGMANSLEIRVPFVDHKVVEFGLGLQSDYKYKSGSLKRFLKDTYSDVLSEEILYRRKTGFVFPIHSWLRNNCKDLALDILSTDIGQYNIFHRKQIDRMTNQFFDKENNVVFKKLWCLIALFGWMRNQGLTFD